MKTLTLPLLGLLAGGTLLASSCKKDSEPASNAIITGYDGQYCGCCGGLMVTFTGDPKPYSSSFKLIDNTADLGLSPTEVFPLYVKIDYVNLPDKCDDNHVRVDQAEEAVALVRSGQANCSAAWAAP
ncbi:MAG: hypothetical protein WKG07_01450 [Hymenobacter sp.]